MRTRAAILLSAIAVPTLALSAHAGPATSKQDVTTKVSGNITELRVDGDVSNVKLTPGSASVVKAHLEWVMRKPDLKVSVAKGVLTVKVRCNDKIEGGGVYVSLVSVCVDDLNIVVPARAKLVVKTGNGNIIASQFTGPVGLTGGTVNVSDLHVPQLMLHGAFGVTAHRLSAPAAQLSAASGDVVVDHVTAEAVALTTSNGYVTGSDLTATTVSASSGSSDVSLARVTAAAVRAASSNGAVHASDVRAHATTLSSGSGDVGAQRIASDRLDVSSSNGVVTITDASAVSTKAKSGSGDVDVQRLRGAQLDVASSNGAVTLGAGHLRVITAESGSGAVVVEDLDAPDSLKATSSNGGVNVRVPHGSYYVDARSSNGHVYLDGLTLDRFAKRQITASSGSGDVSVTGV